MAAKGKNTICAHISSSQTQKPTNTEPTLITFNTNDFINRIIHDESTSNEIITIPEDGIYQIVFSFRGAKDSGGVDRTIDFWLAKNAVELAGALPGTGKSANLKDVDNKRSVTGVFIGELKANDTICAFMKVSNVSDGAGIHAAVAVGSVPAIPSIILNILKIS